VALFLCAALSSPGQTFVLALYLEPIMAAVGASRPAVSMWYAVATFVAAAALLPFGHLADRLSTRRFLLIVIGTIAVGMAILAGATLPWHVLTGFILLRLAGQGAVGVGLLTAVVRRFPVQRGQPLSLANLGYPAGEAVFPFLVIALISSAGWRQSLLFIAVVYVTVAIPALARWLTGTASDRLIDSGSLASEPAGFGSTLAAVRAPSFWAALLAFSTLPVAVTALFFHQVALFRLAGIGESLVPLAFAVYAASHALGTAVLGRSIDAMSPRRTATLSALGLLAAVAIILLPLGTLSTVVGYSVLLGCSSALSSLGGALVWPILFGVTAVGRIRAVSSALRNCATAVGPLLVVIPSAAGILGTLSPLLALVIGGLVAAAWLPARGGDQRRRANTSPRIRQSNRPLPVEP
jgi:predicted MFS family arabinose efflux permease